LFGYFVAKVTKDNVDEDVRIKRKNKVFFELRESSQSSFVLFSFSVHFRFDNSFFSS
jgi:hypothetical protein